MICPVPVPGLFQESDAEEEIDRLTADGIYWQVFFITLNRRQGKERTG